MKKLSQYLLEAEEKTYDFKVKIANIKLDNDVLDRIEHALSAFDISSMDKPKSLPISDKNLDFPALAHCEVNLISVSLKYPCTDAQLLQAISHQARLPASNIVVTPKNQPEELMREISAEDENSNKKYEPILTKELENVSGGQELVGMKRVESMLKELETRRMEFASKDVPQKAKTTNSEEMGNTSPVATKAHKPKGR